MVWSFAPKVIFSPFSHRLAKSHFFTWFAPSPAPFPMGLLSGDLFFFRATERFAFLQLVFFLYRLLFGTFYRTEPFFPASLLFSICDWPVCNLFNTPVVWGTPRDWRPPALGTPLTISFFSESFYLSAFYGVREAAPVWWYPSVLDVCFPSRSWWLPRRDLTLSSPWFIPHGPPRLSPTARFRWLLVISPPRRSFGVSNLGWLSISR